MMNQTQLQLRFAMLLHGGNLNGRLKTQLARGIV